MAKKHVIKYYARLVQKGIYKETDIPEAIRSEVMSMSVTLPLREDMKVKDPYTTPTTNEVILPEVSEINE